jgi:hypothetical protein
VGLVWPIYFLKETDPSKVPQHSFAHFRAELWLTLQNLTTLYLLIYVIGVNGFTNFVSNVNIYLQYYVIELTSFQAGIDTVTSYLALVAAIWVFQTYLINKNWRYTNYASTFASATLGLLWILAYWDIGGMMSPWFTIFIDLVGSFSYDCKLSDGVIYDVKALFVTLPSSSRCD